MADDSLRGIEQGRASFAYQQVKAVAAEPGEELKKKYKSGAKRLPVLIKTNGLAQTLAFIQCHDPGNEALYRQIHDWLDRKKLVPPESEATLIETVINLSSSEYRRLTTETMAFSNWIRRFVDGLMPGAEEKWG